MKNILLIDDNEADNFYHRIILDQFGFHGMIKVAVNGMEALKFFEQDQDFPDLVFLDINMPGMDGFEFIENLGTVRAFLENPKSVIIMLTTSMNPDDFNRANASPYISEFYNKPLSVPILSEIAKKYFS